MFNMGILYVKQCKLLSHFKETVAVKVSSCYCYFEPLLNWCLSALFTTEIMTSISKVLLIGLDFRPLDFLSPQEIINIFYI